MAAAPDLGGFLEQEYADGSGVAVSGNQADRVAEFRHLLLSGRVGGGRGGSVIHTSQA